MQGYKITINELKYIYLLYKIKRSNPLDDAENLLTHDVSLKAFN